MGTMVSSVGFPSRVHPLSIVIQLLPISLILQPPMHLKIGLTLVLFPDALEQRVAIQHFIDCILDLASELL